MKKTIKILSYILLAGFFSIALSGCGTKKQTDPNANKIVVWSFEDEDAWKPIIKSFQSENKDYTLIYQKQTLDDSYENRVLNSILSGQGPDVWSMPNQWVYRHKDQLAAMPDTMAKTINMDNKFVQSIKQSVYFDNKIYALSPADQPLMVYYNPKLFSSTNDAIQNNDKIDSSTKKADGILLDSPPLLWTDFIKTANLLTQKDTKGNITVSGLAMGTKNITNSVDILYLLMMQNYTNIISSDGKVATFNLPKDTSTGSNDYPGKRAMEFFTSFANPASSNYTWNDSLGTDIDAFAEGKAAMILGYSDLQYYYSQKYPLINYKKAFVPQINSDQDKIVDYAKFNAFGVSKLSNNQASAWNLINKLTTDNSGDFNSYSRLYSSTKAGSYDLGLANRTGNNPEKLSLATANSLVRGRFPNEFDQVLKDAIYMVNTGKQDSSSALDLAASNATDLLRKEGW